MTNGMVTICAYEHRGIRRDVEFNNLTGGKVRMVLGNETVYLSASELLSAASAMYALCHQEEAVSIASAVRPSGPCG